MRGRGYSKDIIMGIPLSNLEFAQESIKEKEEKFKKLPSSEQPSEEKHKEFTEKLK